MYKLNMLIEKVQVSRKKKNKNIAAAYTLF